MTLRIEMYGPSLYVRVYRLDHSLSGAFRPGPAVVDPNFAGTVDTARQVGYSIKTISNSPVCIAAACITIAADIPFTFAVGATETGSREL